MALTTSASQTILAGNGATTVWNFSFVAGSASNISVYTISSTGGITLIPPANYAVFLNPAATGAIWGVGGTVTYPLIGSPIAIGTSIWIQRNVPLTQQSALTSGYYTPQAIEQAMDNLCMEIQQVAARGGSMRGYWATNTSYNFGDIVQDGTNGANTLNLYMCAIANTSGTWSTDLAAGDWQLVFNMASYITGLGNGSAYSLFGNNTGVAAPGSFSSSPIISGTLTALRAVFTQTTGTSPFTVSSTTPVSNLCQDLALARTYTQQQQVGSSTLTDAATISWNTNTAQNAVVTLGGNRTVAAPTNLVAGGIYSLRIIQDGTGSRTLTWNAVFKWFSGVAPTLQTAAASVDVFMFISDGTNLYGLQVFNPVNLSIPNLFVAQQNTKTVALIDGAFIAWNLDNAQSAKVTLGGSRTLSNPQKMVDGGCYTLRVTQDGTGSRTLSYDTAYKFPGGVKPILSTAAGAVDILTFTSDGTSMYGSIQKAFS